MMRKNLVRGFLNASLLNRVEGYMDRLYGEMKYSIFKNLPREVVEIGPGPGANLRYYPKGTTVIAIEPNMMMHPALKENARRRGKWLHDRPDAPHQDNSTRSAAHSHRSPGYHKGY